MASENLGLDNEDPTATEGQLTRVSNLARQQLALEDEVARLTAQLKNKEAELRLVAEQDLPRALADCGLSGVDLPGGFKVRDELKYRCGQLDDSPEKKRGADGEPARPLAERLRALAWLDTEGHGDLAKRVVNVVMGRGSEELAQELVKAINEFVRGKPGSNQVAIDTRRVVLWNTLRKFAREEDEAGGEPPLALLGVNKAHVVTITRPEAEL